MMGAAFPLMMLMIASVIQAVPKGNQTDPTVKIRAGALRGQWRSSRYGRNFAAFEGVPYAKPPVGKLRFEPPQPVQPWIGVRDASQPGFACPQPAGRAMPPTNEDCLYLNVYAPETLLRRAPLPVMVFIHGGFFTTGSGSQYGPSFLMDRNVVYVSFNYRLGALGLLSTGDEGITGNFALKDQIAALQWVKDNIHYFGGNPNLVTVFGQSAGSKSVNFLFASPLAKGLFQRAIGMSGTAAAPVQTLVMTGERAKANAQNLAKALGCPTEPTKVLKACLQTKPVSKFVGKSKFYVTVEKPGPLAALGTPPAELYEKGNITDVPYLMGFVSQDGCLYAHGIVEDPASLKSFSEDTPKQIAKVVLGDSYPVSNAQLAFFKTVRKFYFGDKQITKADKVKVEDVFTDSRFILPTLQIISLVTQNNKAPVFYYEIERYKTPSADPKNGGGGMCHSDDLRYFFPIDRLTASDEAFSNKMLDFWISFAVTGSPAPKNIWPPVHQASKAEYLYITSAENITLKSDVHSAAILLWKQMPI